MLRPADSGQDEHWMGVALEQAQQAATHGDVPIGAVVVRNDGALLAALGNRREQESDPTAHAEILALRAAAKQRGHWRLDDCTLYVTLEPCPMCAGALVNSRIGRLVFGAFDPKAGAIESIFRLAEDSRLNHHFPRRSGVLLPECRAALQSFFAKLRAAGEK